MKRRQKSEVKDVVGAKEGFLEKPEKNCLFSRAPRNNHRLTGGSQYHSSSMIVFHSFHSFSLSVLPVGLCFIFTSSDFRVLFSRCLETAAVSLGSWTMR